MTMTVDEVDRALADWQARLRRIDDNLVALETDPVCTLLEAQGDTLEGVTHDRVVPALAAMRELFGQRSLLDDVLERATKLRSGLNRMFPGDRLREIERLLRGPSIALPPVETPLARRGLLDAAETTTTITPEQLLGAMVSSFEQARDAVSVVDAAWSRLTPESDRAAAETDRLQAVAGALGQDASAPLATVRAQLEMVRQRIARDPLGATRALTDDISGRLVRLGQQLAALQARRDGVGADLQRAHVLLADLRAAHQRAAAAHARCEGQVEGVAGTSRPAPLDAGRIDGLAQWLATLDSTVAGGHWAPAGVGVGRWLAAAQAALSEEQAVERGSTAPLDRRDELLGRLVARRQQARTLAARGTNLDPGAEQVADRAERLLRQVPTPVEDAAPLVADYEARLRAATHHA